MRTFVFEPIIPMPLWAILALLAVALGLVYVFYRPPEISRTRRAVVTGLWYLGIACPLVLLLNPTWVTSAEAGKARPKLRVLVDTSQSMATVDMAAQARLAALVADLKRASSSLAADFEVELEAFDEDVRPLASGEIDTLEGTGQVTDLGGAITKSIQSMEQHSGALLLLSDGADNGSEDAEATVKAASLAAALGLPIFTSTYGSTASGRDLAVEALSPRELAFVGQTLTTTALIRQRGFDGAVVQATLWDGSLRVAQKDISLGFGEKTPVTFEISRDKPGAYMYEIEISSSPEEVTRLNNRTSFFLTVVDDAIKVLVLEGKPYWDSKFLLRVLALDKAAAVTSVTRLTDKRFLLREGAADESSGSAKADPDTGSPDSVKIVSDARPFLEDIDALKKYQIIILGRDTEAFLTETGIINLRLWIAQTGGTLLCARGKPVNVVPERFDPVLPVSWSGAVEERMRIRLTPFGESLRWFPDSPLEPNGTLSDKMPSLATSSAVRNTKPLASVVAKAESSGTVSDMPVITYLPYGSGRSLVLEGSGIWRWAFLAPKYESYSTLYSYFWASLLRWMVSSTDFLPSQTCALRSSRPAFTTREKAIVFAILKSEEEEFSATNPPVIELIPQGASEGEVITAAPAGKEVGLFRIVAGPLEKGYYQARLKRTSDAAPAECVFQVQPPIQEQLDVAARPLLMARIAGNSGGEDLTGRALSEIHSAYASYWQRTHPALSRHASAWDDLWVMMAAIGIWSIAWIVRRRGGLI